MNMKMENRHEFFKRRLKEMGLYDEKSDYNGLVGKWVEALSDTFEGQGHSGQSAENTIRVFKRLMDEYGLVLRAHDTLVFCAENCKEET